MFMEGVLNLVLAESSSSTRGPFGMGRSLVRSIQLPCYMYIYMYIYIHIVTHIYIQTGTYVYIYIYVCVDVGSETWRKSEA